MSDEALLRFANLRTDWRNGRLIRCLTGLPMVAAAVVAWLAWGSAHPWPGLMLADQLSSMQAQADAIAEQAKVNAKSAEKAVSSVAKSVVPQKKSVAASASSDVLEANTGVGAQDIGMTTATPGSQWPFRGIARGQA